MKQEKHSEWAAALLRSSYADRDSLPVFTRLLENNEEFRSAVEKAIEGEKE